MYFVCQNKFSVFFLDLCVCFYNIYADHQWIFIFLACEISLLPFGMGLLILLLVTVLIDNFSVGQGKFPPSPLKIRH
jgi:hypothetical protein